LDPKKWIDSDTPWSLWDPQHSFVSLIHSM
jgi:hypothetical protein